MMVLSRTIYAIFTFFFFRSLYRLHVIMPFNPIIMTFCQLTLHVIIMIYQSSFFSYVAKMGKNVTIEIQTGWHIDMLKQILFILKSLDHLTTRKTTQKQGFVTLNFNNDSPARHTGLSRGHVTHFHSFIHTLHTQYSYTFLSKHRKRPGLFL